MDMEKYSAYNPVHIMVIQRYMLNHLMKVFLGAALVLYGVMFIVQWIRIGQVMSIEDIDVLLLALVPLAIFVLPMALIFSVLMVLEKFSTESEIIAMQACGIRMRTVHAPIIAVSLVCLILHVSIATYLGPLSMQRIQERLVERAPEKVYSFIKEREFVDTFSGVTLYVESVNQVARELHNVFIETQGAGRSIIAAEKGTIDFSSSGILMRLSDGSVFMESGKNLRYITFREYSFSLDADFKGELRIRGADVLTQPQLAELIRENPKPKLIKEYHNRYSFPVINLILALVGIQFGVQRPRSPRHSGIVFGLGTILGYYLLFLLADRLVKGGVLNPVIGAWTPNMIFCLILLGVFLWRRTGLGKGGA
jgi:LPS export ABC transporter permease LptF